MTEPLLDVRGLGIHFRTEAGEVQATRDVSFAVRPGERVGIVVMLDGDGAFRRSWPELAHHFDEQQFRPYVARTGDSAMTVWLPARAAAAPIDAATALPCAPGGG